MNELQHAFYAAAFNPVVVVVTIICVFVAGVVCGRAWREHIADAHADAGDTHAQMRAGDEPFDAWPRSCTASTRRVRAGKAPLPYSFDSRKPANPAAPPSPPSAS